MIFESYQTGRSAKVAIQTFKSKALKKLYEKGDASGVSGDIADKLLRRLDTLDAATVISDLNLPGFRLHQLKGDRRGTWAIDISGNWRLTFKFQDGDALEVNLEDYH
jgi:proteic killer suppression protein